MKRIVCVLGSPNEKGCSATLAQRFCDTARAQGAEVTVFMLNKLKYRGCQACKACKGKTDHCVIKDDLTPVFEAVKTADILVMASPIYFGEVTAQLKGFIDRAYAWLVPDFYTAANKSRLPPGKRLVFILTQGSPDEKHFADVFPRYNAFFTWYGFIDSRLIRVCGVRTAGDVKARTAALELTDDTARALLGS